jgi:anti-sigma-K factor RskA
VAARIVRPSSEEDRALAEAVGAARDMLLPLDLTASNLPLGPDAWARIEARLPDRPATGSPAETVPAGRTVIASVRRGWQFATLFATAAAVILAVVLAWQTLLAPKPSVLVVLLDTGGEAVAVLEAYPDNRVVVTPLQGVVAGPAQVLQLWTKPDPAGPPVSVGLLQTVARMVVRNRDLPQPSDGQLYEITLEPAGGSPTGLPTGPVVGVGNAQVPLLSDG